MNDVNTQVQYVAAFFDDRRSAEQAIERLESDGVSRSDVRMVEGHDPAPTTGGNEKKEKGFFETLGDMFMPVEDRNAYAEGLNRGGYFVSVTTNMENRDRIIAILDSCGTVDMDEREETWRSEGWTGHEDYREAQTRTGEGVGESGTVPVVEEDFRVGKREVAGERVRVRSYVVETPVEEQVGLRDEKVRVERRPVDRPLAADDRHGAFEERTIEATETREEPVVSKEARVKEEITIGKDEEHRTETVSDTVRHTKVDVDRESADRRR